MFRVNKYYKNETEKDNVTTQWGYDTYVKLFGVFIIFLCSYLENILKISFPYPRSWYKNSFNKTHKLKSYTIMNNTLSESAK